MNDLNWIRIPHRIVVPFLSIGMLTAMACGTNEFPSVPPATPTFQATEMPISTVVPTTIATTIPHPSPVSKAVPAATVTSSPTPTATPAPEPTVVMETQHYEDYSSMIDSDSVAKLDEHAPDFEIALFDGEVIRLSDLEGSVVVLNFWASWCPPCRWEMPSFEHMSKEYKDKGVIFLGVAISDYSPDARAFADKTGVTYPIGLDESGEIARSYRPTSMPTTFFIDREGVVSRKLVSVANEAVLRVFLDGQLNQ